MQTDRTLTCLEDTTKKLGNDLRHFQSRTCEAIPTVETPKEADARKRNRAAQQKKAGSSTRKVPLKPAKSSSARRAKKFSLRTIKLHLLGHYVHNIRRLGSTDSYSTQVVRLALLLLPELN